MAKYLPPASEVWGKIIFSEACGSHSVHRGSLYDVTSCLAAWFHVPSVGGLHLWSQVSLKGLCPGWSLSRVVSVQGGLCPGWSLSRWSLSRLVSVQGGLYPGWSLSRVFCPGWSMSRGLCPRESLPKGVSVRETPWTQTPIQ